MSQLPAMPMWWGEFFNKTDHLTNAEQWAYAKLLAKTWIRNAKPFPDNNRDIARLLGLTLAKWLKMRPRIEPFFDLSDGTWRQSRLEKEFVFVSERAANSRKNGKLGGRPKVSENNVVANPAGSPQQTPEEPTYTHTHKEGSVGSSEPTAAKAALTLVVTGTETPPKPDPKTELYTLGKKVLGKSSGGQITKLIAHHAGNLAAAKYTLGKVAEAAFPAEYLGKILSGEAAAPHDFDAELRRMGVRPDGMPIGFDSWVPPLQRPGDDGRGPAVH